MNLPGCIEVFRTNVNDPLTAFLLLEKIHGCFDNCSASFDLEDCDRILRVDGQVPASALIGLLQDYGFQAEVLPD